MNLNGLELFVSGARGLSWSLKKKKSQKVTDGRLEWQSRIGMSGTWQKSLADLSFSKNLELQLGRGSRRL